VPGGKVGLAIRQIVRSDVVIIFGGTNFTRQWFYLNIPYYFLTTLIAKICRARVYFTPQQYGPMTPLQRFLTRIWIRLLVDDYRVRNPLCLKELNVPVALRAGKEICDEVYSNRHLYPVVENRVEENEEYVLINLRGSNLVEGQVTDELNLENFADFLIRLHNRFHLPYIFFSVSDGSFCDDNYTYERLKILLPTDIILRSVGRVRDADYLIALAEKALACISMSFHGCLISGMAGIPYMPVTNGGYYDYKYAGFSKYGDGWQIPLLTLDNRMTDSELENIVSYIKTYDSWKAAVRRKNACEFLEDYYKIIADSVR
jgi:hypothetical protein